MDAFDYLGGGQWEVRYYLTSKRNINLLHDIKEDSALSYSLHKIRSGSFSIFRRR
jgi:hypothetical protein